MIGRPRVAVSACVLGERVRWDGRDKREALVTDELAATLELVPVCPEVAVGMGVPREPVHLVADGEGTRLRGVQSGRDWTEAMRAWAEAQVRALADAGVAGVILKSRSPSCGLAGVAVLGRARDEAGLFAAAVLRAGLPVIDEAALHDPAARDAFLTRVFARARLAALAPRELLATHRRLLRAFGRVRGLEALVDDPPAFRARVAALLAGTPDLVRPLAAALRASGATPGQRAVARAALRALREGRVAPDVARACVRRASVDVDALLEPYPALSASGS